jgi:hypothetical protein
MPIFSSIGQMVWPIEIPQFLAQNLHHHPDSMLGATEVEFGPLPMAKHDWKAEQITKKETAQHYHHESSTELTTGSGH